MDVGLIFLRPPPPQNKKNVTQPPVLVTLSVDDLGFLEFYPRSQPLAFVQRVFIPLTGHPGKSLVVMSQKNIFHL